MNVYVVEVCSSITDERPQLRRPADPNMDDLSKRVNKMDPYGQGNPYGNPYNQPHPRGMAPRPAPNADGWSSGENHFSQQQLYQYQQQQQQVWPLTQFFLFPFC